MNTKILSSISAALIFSSFVAPASAGALSEHSGVVAEAHWSATIGSGYSVRTSETKCRLTKSQTTNTVATPDWTSNIGTGMAASRPSATPETPAPVTSRTSRTVGTADWSSRIGSGHPFDAAKPVASTTVANAL